MLQHRKMFLWALLLAVSLPAVASSSSSRLVGVTTAFHPLPSSLAGWRRCGSNTCSTGPSSAIQPHSGLDDAPRNDSPPPPPPPPGLQQQRMHRLLTVGIDCPSPSSDSSSAGSYYSSSRRTVVTQGLVRASLLLVVMASATTCGVPAWAAKPDCYTDCYKNCQALAPKDLDYCRDSCLEYCQQPDRQDGLSGSVSAAQGETGILGGSFGQGTVPKGQDRPPSLIQIPGLDFTSAAGRKLIGY